MTEETSRLFAPGTNCWCVETATRLSAIADADAYVSAARHARRFGIYHPVTSGGTPIDVYAKILVVDDVILKLGSSNMNNRSMRLDTECDLTIDGRGDAAHRQTIAAIRDGLLAEHLGTSTAEVRQRLAKTGSLIPAIEGLRGCGGRTLIPYEIPDLSSVEEWLADNEVLDPEGPDELIEPPDEHRLFRARTGLLNRLLRS